MSDVAYVHAYDGKRERIFFASLALMQTYHLDLWQCAQLPTGKIVAAAMVFFNKCIDV